VRDVSLTSLILIGCVSNPRKVKLTLTMFTSRLFQFTSNDNLLFLRFYPLIVQQNYQRLKIVY
jgi:hypothetical protein